jgi:phosphatidylserine/phosphatidylglycerophosphate/cardiolipin synthase-like enzyme
MARRLFAYLVFIAVIGIVAGIRFYPQIRRWLPATQGLERPLTPVAAPGSAPVEGPYFSDGGRVGDRIVAAIHHTQKTLHVAIYDLTEPNIAAALVDAHRRGVEVRVVADEGQSRQPHSQVTYLRTQGIDVRLSHGYRDNRSIMHNKFAVFDGKLAETGSFNWTTSADEYNYENALFVADPAVVARYDREFQRIWKQAR